MRMTEATATPMANLRIEMQNSWSLEILLEEKPLEALDSSSPSLT
jgi:hypothetical protein